MSVCTICGKEITDYTNNAWPVNFGQCCAKCNNDYVIPARLKHAKLDGKINSECDRTGSKREGIDKLISYYRYQFGWSEIQAMEYIVGLFKNGTIEKIVVWAGPKK